MSFLVKSSFFLAAVEGVRMHYQPHLAVNQGQRVQQNTRPRPPTVSPEQQHLANCMGRRHSLYNTDQEKQGWIEINLVGNTNELTVTLGKPVAGDQDVTQTSTYTKFEMGHDNLAGNYVKVFKDENGGFLSNKFSKTIHKMGVPHNRMKIQCFSPQENRHVAIVWYGHQNELEADNMYTPVTEVPYNQPTRAMMLQMLYPNDRVLNLCPEGVKEEVTPNTDIVTLNRIINSKVVLKNFTVNEREANEFLSQNEIPNVVHSFGTCTDRDNSQERLFLQHIPAIKPCHELMAENQDYRQQIVQKARTFLQEMTAVSAYSTDRHASLVPFGRSSNIFCLVTPQGVNVYMHDFEDMHFPGATTGNFGNGAINARQHNTALLNQFN